MMRRVASALMLGAAVLLSAYVSAPAAPVPPPARISSADIAEIETMAPLAAEAAQETERLRTRLESLPAKPVPQRDPFRFGAPRERPPEPAPASSVGVLEAAAEPAAADEVPAIAWPTLVAVLQGRGDTPELTAVLASGDRIAMLKVGGELGGFVVREIAAASVALEHVATSATIRLTLR